MSVLSSIKSAMSNELVQAVEMEVLSQMREHVEMIARPVAHLLANKGIDIQEADVKNVLIGAIEHLEGML